MKKFTDKEMANFEAYKRVQDCGRFNMFDPNARLITGLSKTEYFAVMTNYGELAEAAANKETQ